MKKPANFFLWIVLLAVSLLVIITIAQIITQKSLSRLRQGNTQATSTFIMNNRLEEMVNLAFELETKIINGKSVDLLSVGRGIKDSLTRLQYNITVLEKVWADTTQLSALAMLVNFVDKQVGVSFNILNAIEHKNMALQKLMTDSLRNNHWGDSIYLSAILFQKGLEQNLSATLKKNNEAAYSISKLNIFLTGVASAAILILATIIIRRQVKQLYLIKDLHQARKVALLSKEAKENFLANMSHEIRTPLNAIKGFGKILLKTPLNKEQQQYASIISTSSENLLNIVNDILDYSKIEAGNLVLKNKAFQLTTMLNDVELMFAPLIQEKSLKLFLSTDKRIPEFVKGDPERLRQILINLVSNAIKFTNAGNVSVMVKLIEEKNDIIKTKFIVSDTGVGIPFENIRQIFERFEQLDHSLTRQQGGTGLGLSITKNLVEAMGGKISVKSEVNRGSVFEIELAFEKMTESTVEKEVFGSSGMLENISLANLRILIAEDNEMNQLLIKSILDNYGVSSKIVENGEQAINAIRENEYDLVLMDIQMPKIDGITAVKLMRKELKILTPVIAMTAHVLPGEREKCIEAGMNDYLTKPLDEDEVINMLNKYALVRKKTNSSAGSFAQIDWLNMKYLNSICGNDEKRILTILKELKRQLPIEIDKLQKSMVEFEPDKLKTICHHLQSTLSPFLPTAASVFTLRRLVDLLNKELPESQIVSGVQQLIKNLAAVEKGLDDVIGI
jgi:signal transduction histidine kinase/CheY-like chemotaxis protein